MQLNVKKKLILDLTLSITQNLLDSLLTIKASVGNLWGTIKIKCGSYVYKHF